MYDDGEVCGKEIFNLFVHEHARKTIKRIFLNRAVERNPESNKVILTCYQKIQKKGTNGSPLPPLKILTPSPGEKQTEVQHIICQ